MEHVDIIPPSERRRINERVFSKEDKMDENDPHTRRALMAFIVITIPGSRRRVCCRKAGCKSNHRYPIFDGWIGASL